MGTQCSRGWLCRLLSPAPQGNPIPRAGTTRTPPHTGPRASGSDLSTSTSPAGDPNGSYRAWASGRANRLARRSARVTATSTITATIFQALQRRPLWGWAEAPAKRGVPQAASARSRDRGQPGLGGGPQGQICTGQGRGAAGQGTICVVGSRGLCPQLPSLLLNGNCLRHPQTPPRPGLPAPISHDFPAAPQVQAAPSQHPHDIHMGVARGSPLPGPTSPRPPLVLVTSAKPPTCTCSARLSPTCSTGPTPSRALAAPALLPWGVGPHHPPRRPPTGPPRPPIHSPCSCHDDHVTRPGQLLLPYGTSRPLSPPGP